MAVVSPYSTIFIEPALSCLPTSDRDVVVVIGGCPFTVYRIAGRDLAETVDAQAYTWPVNEGT